MKRMIDSELIEALGTDIKFDGNGNVIVGKNLEVGGTTKLNKGIKPIHTFPLNDYTVEVLFERYVEFVTDYTFFGYIVFDDGSSVPCIGSYIISQGVLEELSAISYNAIYSWTKGGALEEKAIATELYRHIIQLSGGGSADNICRLEWISPNNLQCDSLQDLRTVLGNPQMQSYVASNPSGDLFGVVISMSTAQIKKVGTTSLLNITSVSDTVTPL